MTHTKFWPTGAGFLPAYLPAQRPISRVLEYAGSLPPCRTASNTFRAMAVRQKGLKSESGTLTGVRLP